MDFSSFANDNFEAKEWINQAFKSRDGETKEAFASSLVMKLQLFVQEVNNALEATAQQVALNLPRIIKEAEAMGEEARFLQDQMAAVRQEICKVEHPSLQTISQLDDIKGRMLEASKALREADNWSTLSSGVEEVFQSGDISAIAVKLSDMQRCLELLRNVPDYAERSKLLEQHKDRLEAMLTPLVVAAFNSHSMDAALVYTRIFKEMDRLKALQKYYHDCHKEQLTRQWGQICSLDPEESVPEWLNAMLDALLSTWHAQAGWCCQVFPTQTDVLLELLADVLASLEPPLPDTLDKVMAATKPPQQLPLLGAVKKTLDRFSRSLQAALPPSASNSPQLPSLLRVLYSPLRNQLDCYAKLEVEHLVLGLHLGSELSLVKGVNLLEDSVSRVRHLVAEADSRCRQLSHGFALPALILAYQDFYLRYLARHRDVSGQIKRAQREDVWTLFQLVLSTLQAGGEILLQLRELGQALLAELRTLGSQLEATDRDPFSCHDHYLLSPPLKSSLRDLLIKMEGKQLQPLESVMEEFHSHCGTLRLMLFEVSFRQVQSQLRAVPSLEVWKKKDVENDVDEELPAFSLSPQEYVTQIGQYLMTLPQHIEPFVAQDNPALVLALGTDQEHAAHSILSQLGNQTVHHYVDAILQIPELSRHSASQLVADIEYLRDVLEDLGLTPADNLLAVRDLVGCSPSEFLSAARGKPHFIRSALQTMRAIRS